MPQQIPTEFEHRYLKYVRNCFQTIAFTIIKNENASSTDGRSLNNPPHFFESHSKIYQQPSQIKKNVSLDRFRRQFAPRSAPGCHRSLGVLLILVLRMYIRSMFRDVLFGWYWWARFQIYQKYFRFTICLTYFDPRQQRL